MTGSRHSYDVIVVGAGHAGIEAACAAARIGCRTALLTGNLDTIGKMSCNPAIGGLAKGQLVREIDALGGVMAMATDACGIHFRTLATGKGPAVWSPRAQCDKAAYSLWMKDYVERQPHLFPIQGEAIDLDTDAAGAIAGIRLKDGRTLQSGRVVLTTGTFLQALMHLGESQVPGGRAGDHATTGISAALRDLGLDLIRLKTGTPPRVHLDSIDFSHCQEQAGEDEPQRFSFRDSVQPRNQVVCWIAHTTTAAHEHILANLDRAPMYNGQIDSAGPRYCPSIEDKVVRFSDRGSHQLFLEPEGISTKEVYVNGLSTSLPIDIQDAVLSEIPALAKAHVLRYGYAVEYDAVRSDQIDHRLGVPSVPGLYLAGQINGTSGYEEAGMQGLVAGANAALSLLGRAPLMLSRADSYGGVLIDDLVTRVPDEPYRMFTSRAEHRMFLRSDNADRRLVPLAAKAGLVDEDFFQSVTAKIEVIDQTIKTVSREAANRIAGEGLSFPQTLALTPELEKLDRATAQGVWIDLRYAHYLERQRAQIERIQRQRDLRLPDDVVYEDLVALSKEARRILAERRPQTLGEAGSLPGVNPADIETLWAWLQGRHKQAG